MKELIYQILNNPLPSVAIICNLVIIESLLSVDNAAVLATMVLELPTKQRTKALKYGLVGAYLFRGLALGFAFFLIKVWWLKPIGGLYLVYLFVNHFIGKRIQKESDNFPNKQSNWFYKTLIALFGNFWATVLMIEFMDIAFSMDNIFAAVAFTPNIILVCIGVFIGIFAMRHIAQWFVKLMDKFKFLENAAFIVIGLLGIKLFVSIIEHIYPQSSFSLFIGSRMADIATSAITVVIFFIPVFTSLVFNYPKKLH